MSELRKRGGRMNEKFGSRKFILAATFTISGIAALFAGFMAEGSFLGLAGIVLGLYSAANVTEKKQ